MQDFMQKYVDQLYANLNNGANYNQQNLFSKAEYYEILKPVIEILEEHKDASLEELRNILFMRSGIKEAAETLVKDLMLTTGLVFSYGTSQYHENVVIGNREEVILDAKGNVVPNIKPMSEDTIFDLASVTKLYTSLSILKLVELGLVDLNDYITKYVPEFKNLQNVSIMDLLTFSVPLATSKRVDNAQSLEEAESILFDIKVNENFNFDSNSYTDMGAMVLKYVIERVTEMPYYDFLKESILLPLELSDTHVIVPETKIERVASTNLGYQIDKDGHSLLTTEALKGVAYDPKARVMGQPSGNLSGHAGLFSSVSDMTKLSQALMDGKIISKDAVENMGINRTGKLKSDGSGYTQHLGELVYSKNPDINNSEVWQGLSGRSFASAGWLGHKLAFDPLNNVYAFMAANKSHNRVTSVSPAVRPAVEEIQDGKTLIKLPNGELKIDSSKFAWYKHTIVNPCLKLSLQYQFLDRILGIQYDQTQSITRNF